MDEATLDAMHDLWQHGAGRDVSDLWSAILAMGDDPIFIADRIAEAGDKDPSVAVADDVLDSINDVAVNGPETAAAPRSLSFSEALAEFRQQPTRALALGLGTHLASNPGDLYRLNQEDVEAINRMAKQP